MRKYGHFTQKVNFFVCTKKIIEILLVSLVVHKVGELILLTLGVHAHSEGYGSCPVCVLVCVCL